jgi:hypothetical protein
MDHVILWFQPMPPPSVLDVKLDLKIELMIPACRAERTIQAIDRTIEPPRHPPIPSTQ